MHEPCFEVAIIGGGPAGTATAIALKNLGIDHIFLAEAGNYRKPKIGESIPPDSKKLLQQLGVFQAFIEQGHDPCLGSYSSWGSQQLGHNDNLFNPHGSGWHLDRCKFDKFLAEQCRLQGIVCREGVRCTDIGEVPGNRFPYQLAFDGHDVIRSRFIVDATGQNATIARKFGGHVEHQDRMLSIAAYFNCTGQGQNQLTLLEAVEQGWWYCAKLPDNRMVVSLTTDVEIAQEMDLRQLNPWFKLLQSTRYVSKRVNGLAMLKSLNIWKTPSAILDPPAGSGWLAVGDAASCYDPISSQGIYKAMNHGLKAAGAIHGWLQGDAQAITQYRRRVGEDFLNYLQQREYFYGQEQRWPDSPFWQQRRDSFAALEEPAN